GNSVQTIQSESGKPIATPAEPTRTGFTFLGWYTALTGGTRWTFGENGQILKSDLTLYARWTAKSFMISAPAQTASGKIDCTILTAKVGDTVTPVWVEAFGNYRIKKDSVGYRIANDPKLYKLDEQASTGTADGKAKLYSFVMPAADVTLEAVFEELPSYAVTLAQGVPENAITVTPLSETKTYVVGTVLTVTVTVPAGQSMEEGSLTCTTVGNVSVTLTPEQTTGGATPTKYRFIMPEGAVTLNAVFKALPTHVVTAAVVPNGTITVQPAAAAEGVVVHVDLTPNPGYRLKTRTMGYYLKAGEDVHYPLAVAGSNNGYQFTMPNVAVTVYAEFEKIPETPLLPNPKLSINQNRWDIYFNVPQELKQQVAGLQYNSRYVETTLLNAAGDVVLRQRSINAGISTSGESYYTLYRTAALQPGNY
ncbi:MAG: InlB B-repeat-containing protein, partial [Oscillospiraceae bacterium]